MIIKHGHSRDSNNSTLFIDPPCSASARSVQPTKVSPVPAGRGGSFGIEMHRGYFKIWRKIEDSAVYRDGTAMRIFLDLLIRAHWCPGRKLIVAGKEIALNPGQLTIGRFEMASRLGMNAITLYKGIVRLKSKYHIIDYVGNNKFTVVTILNWDSYQSEIFAEEQRSNNKVTTKEQQSNTLKAFKHLNIKKSKGFLSDKCPTDVGLEGDDSLTNQPKPTILETEYSIFSTAWNTLCGGLPKVSEVSNQRKSKIKLRLKDRPIEEWKLVFKKLAESAFCNGSNNREWKASFDWIIANDNNAVKVLEGKYDNRNGNSGVKEDIWATAKMIS